MRRAPPAVGREDLAPCASSPFTACGERGRGSLTVCAPASSPCTGAERVGRGLPHLVRQEADLCALRTLRSRPTQPPTRCLRVSRRPAIWRCPSARRARRKTNEILCAECSLGLGYPLSAPSFTEKRTHACMGATRSILSNQVRPLLLRNGDCPH